MAINLELFSCAGGMAAGFRRAGIEFDIAVDFARDHCDSYEHNLGHRPHQVDVRGLLAVIRRIRRGRSIVQGPVARLARTLLDNSIDLLVADPPCTPWSRAGKRMGTDDDRDMLGVTCSLIGILRPRRYVIGNVPGLDDSNNLGVVHRTIGRLAILGYCVADFARLDAASYGVPQHRVRPWWFGHLAGPCITWPAPTHCDPLDLATLPLPGIAPLRPWVTCRDALGHLSPEELGRPVKMRKCNDHGHQKGSVADRPARTVGTSNLSDGNNLALPTRHERPVHTSEIDSPARSITTQCRAPGHATTVVLNGKHSSPSSPSKTIGAKSRGNGGCAVFSLAEPTSKHPAATSGRKRKRPPSTKGPLSTRTISPDAPSTTVQAREDRVGSGSPVLNWPWPRPATPVTSRPGLAPPGHHDESFAIMSLPDAVILSERAAAILQGFPDDGSWKFCGATKKARWGQIGQSMPIALAQAVATSVVEQDSARSQGVLDLGGTR